MAHPKISMFFFPTYNRYVPTYGRISTSWDQVPADAQPKIPGGLVQIRSARYRTGQRASVCLSPLFAAAGK